jgi:hypothetical protein
MRLGGRVLGMALAMIGVMGVASIARADKEIPASLCHPFQQGTDGYPRLNSGSWFTNTINVIFECPYVEILSVATEQKSNVNRIFIDATDNSTTYGVVIAACSIPYGGGGLHCGASISSGTVYTGTTTAISESVSDMSYWSSTYSNDYGFVQVTVPPASSFRGLYVLYNN